MSGDPWLHAALGLDPRHTPFPWQEALVLRFLKRNERAAHGSSAALDIPTGLGKTATMAAWLVALARGASIPRRLVYVVDRRAVVDQATKFAEDLRAYVETNPMLKAGLGLREQKLPISTLRGQHADNREWLADPSIPGIVVGTVDMVGSRLLFGGYGVSRKMRPYHAGFLGADTLIVIDESHLVPPFERLIHAIATDQEQLRPEGAGRHASIPALELLALSATGRSDGRSNVIGLDDTTDLKHPVVDRRLRSRKRVTTFGLVERDLADVLAEQAWGLTEDGQKPMRLIVYCNSREVAQTTKQAIEKLAGDRAELQLFVGERRVNERAAAARWLETRGYLAGKGGDRTKPAIVVATSAGEVGVDLDADHMVCDLVTWERMVQRFGRVNRRGDGDARIIVVLEPDPAPDKKVVAALEKAADDRDDDDRELVERHLRWTELARAKKTALALLLDGDASPGALRALKKRAESEPAIAATLDAATSRSPLGPALTRPVVDAWTLTSIEEDPSRPDVAPWLRGWVDDEPQTTVVWREHVPARTDGKEATMSEVEGFFEAAPPHLLETLEAPTETVANWLAERAHAVQQFPAPEVGELDTRVKPETIVAFLLSPAGDLDKRWALRELDLESIEDKKQSKRKADDLERDLRDKILVVDVRLAGLRDGLLAAAVDETPTTADHEPRDASWDGVDFRVIEYAPDGRSLDEEAFRFVIMTSPNGEAELVLGVEHAETEEERSVGNAQELHAHHACTEDHAKRLGERLGLGPDLANVLRIAARLHDEGKRARIWQRAFNAPRDGVYAKTKGPVSIALLDGYRHELGSLPAAMKDAAVGALPPDLRDLVLHLIAAHHGNARPRISTRGCEDGPPSAMTERAAEIARRFLRLQQQWGPWGLAWLESLLRSADQLASRDNDDKQVR